MFVQGLGAKIGEAEGAESMLLISDNATQRHMGERCAYFAIAGEINADGNLEVRRSYLQARKSMEILADMDAEPLQLQAAQNYQRGALCGAQ